MVNGYELLDFGHGRKLERLGGVVLDRPCPAAAQAPRVPCSRWQADARFVEAKRSARGVSPRLSGGSRGIPARAGSAAGQKAVAGGERGHWECVATLPEDWHVWCGGVKLGLRLAASGQVGVFPEHAAYWPWIGEQVQQAGRGVRVLNLFAYTGGATLAAAAAGAEVVHVDAARSAVHWARQNAEQAGLANAAIRWIVDDCRAFVARELRRGRTYDGLILDPPSYGHGSRGQGWRISADLEDLLSQCAQLLGPQPRFVLCTCHTPGFGPARLARLLERLLGLTAVCCQQMRLTTAAGRALACGAAACWAATTD